MLIPSNLRKIRKCLILRYERSHVRKWSTSFYSRWSQFQPVFCQPGPVENAMQPQRQRFPDKKPNPGDILGVNRRSQRRFHVEGSAGLQILEQPETGLVIHFEELYQTSLPQDLSVGSSWSKEISYGIDRPANGAKYRHRCQWHPPIRHSNRNSSCGKLAPFWRLLSACQVSSRAWQRSDQGICDSRPSKEVLKKAIASIMMKNQQAD